jgi:ADP-ribose pyrophosphatase YjhB (NUDIX family)
MLKKIIGTIWRKLPPAARQLIVRSTQEKFTVSVTGIITNEADEILLLEHVLRPASGWGVPGGFIEAGEQPEAGLRREIREEISLELENVKLLRVRTIRRHIEILFSAEAVGTPVVSSREIKDFGWFEFDSMPKGMSRFQKATIENFLKK